MDNRDIEKNTVNKEEKVNDLGTGTDSRQRKKKPMTQIQAQQKKTWREK